MSILELSVLTAVFIVIAFTMGFLFGIGYQSAEDRRIIKKMRNDYKKTFDNITEEAYQMGRRHEREEAQQKAEQEWKELMLCLEQSKEDIKFGGF